MTNPHLRSILTIDPATSAAIDSRRLEGVRRRRAIAFIIDLAIIGCLYVVATAIVRLLVAGSLGLLGGFVLVLPLVPTAYHVWTLTRFGATFGQTLVGLEVRDLELKRPDWIAALVHIAVFWLLMSVTGSLALLATFLFERKRLLHDCVSGLQVLRRIDAPEILMPRRAS
jgi:uncharacterized RDD family membrane protein YckC